MTNLTKNCQWDFSLFIIKLRKTVRNRGHFPSENSVMKVLYLAIKGVSKKWSMPIRDWKYALNRFAIKFGDRFPDNL
jgi:putative transposase